MDEYDELFEIEDDFENQFADELEALADMEKGEEQQLANTECRYRCLCRNSYNSNSGQYSCNITHSAHLLIR